MAKNQTIQLLKRWINIIFGKSAAAVEQGVGRCYSKTEIKGYYNDLTNKVSTSTLLDKDGIPYNVMSSGEKVYSLVTIFQYALGCYDLYLLENDSSRLNVFLKLAEYVLENQEDNGKWDARSSMGSKRDNSSCMAQGQGCCIMIRAYLHCKDKKYLECAEKAIRFMLTPVEQGGTMLEAGERITFEKYPPENGKASSVLNGWAFALFGLYDYFLLTRSEEIKKIFDASCCTLVNKINLYDRGYWSMYDLVGTIASPAYHTLHSALLIVLADLSDQTVLEEYAKRFDGYYHNPFKKGYAVIRKLVQKLMNKSDTFIVQ